MAGTQRTRAGLLTIDETTYLEDNTSGLIDPINHRTSNEDINASTTNFIDDNFEIDADLSHKYTADPTGTWDASVANDLKFTPKKYVDSSVSGLLLKTMTIEAPSASDDLTLMRTDVAITVQEVIAVNTGTTPNTTYQLKFGADRSGVGTDLTTSSATTSITSGDVATLGTASIPADNWIWLETTLASGDDVVLSVNVRYTKDS